ncbi:Metallothionein-like protein [Dorcoceras hygrometricum]|uniref:Metallothionein-like protein n=1 Tax=Dorcoceras hygrometricum TaxID=472368 RepID=A0A2Z6ZXW9_9LAMI|nr:Metallothionein-like protein [Dorcoceras hygrometricum]
MSNCGGNCGCGSSCKCGNGCGCSMYPDVEKDTSLTIIEGVAPLKKYSEASGQRFGSEGGQTCKCGSNCTCDSCKC